MIIRAATEDDARAIARVHLDSWVQTYTGLFPPQVFDELSLESRERLWRRTAAAARAQPQRRTELLVAEEDAHIVGFVSLGPFRAGEGGQGDGAMGTSADSARGELNAIYLAPGQQRRGIGRALFNAGTGWLRSAGYTDMRLWVLDRNPDALAFYRALGGERVDSKTFDLHGTTLGEQCWRYPL